MKNQEEEKDRQKLSEEEFERLMILQKSKEKKGKQLSFNSESGNFKEEEEIKLKKTYNPLTNYNVFYKGIMASLKTYLPKGKENEKGRRLIYDEIGIFNTDGKIKSDNNGVRGADSRMGFEENKQIILDLINIWIKDSQNPYDLYLKLYDLNESRGYGHENYDQTTKNFKKAKEREGKEE